MRLGSEQEQSGGEPKSLARQAAMLDHSLCNLKLQLEKAVKDGLDPYPIQEQLPLIHAKIEQHQLRIVQRIEDVCNIYGGDLMSAIIADSLETDEEKIEAVKGMLNEDFDFIMLHTMRVQDTEVRELSARGLLGTSDPECLKALCEVGLRDKEYSVMNASAAALQGTTDEETLKWLCEAGLGSEDPDLRKASAIALTGTKCAACLEALREGLNDERPGVRVACAEALTNTTDPSCLKALCEVVISDEEDDVRKAAASSLSHTTDPTCLRVLSEVGLKDQSHWVRQASAWSLKGTTDPACLKSLCNGLTDETELVRRAAAYSLAGTSDAETLVWLSEVGLKNKDVELRRVSALSLQHTKDPGCRQALISAAKDEKEDEVVREAARAALK